MYFSLALVLTVLLPSAYGQGTVNSASSTTLPQYPNLCILFVTAFQRVANASSSFSNARPPLPQLPTIAPVTPSQTTTVQGLQPPVSSIILRQCLLRFTSTSICEEFPDLANNLFGITSYLTTMYRRCHDQHVSAVASVNTLPATGTRNQPGDRVASMFNLSRLFR